MVLPVQKIAFLKNYERERESEIFKKIIFDNYQIWFFLTDTPRKLYYLHTCSWMANMFGVFLILAAHEHYSIDVFVAFYLTSRLFLYYHTLANNRSLMDRDKGRRRFWFPLFSFFESKCDGVVPNEFEWPVPRMIEGIKNSFGYATPLKPKTNWAQGFLLLVFVYMLFLKYGIYNHVNLLNQFILTEVEILYHM